MDLMSFYPICIGFFIYVLYYGLQGTIEASKPKLLLHHLLFIGQSIFPPILFLGSSDDEIFVLIGLFVDKICEAFEKTKVALWMTRNNTRRTLLLITEEGLFETLRTAAYFCFLMPVSTKQTTWFFVLQTIQPFISILGLICFAPFFFD